MHGPHIIARTMSSPSVRGTDGSLWQYHSRSDQHSKVACWAVVFDVLQRSEWLRNRAVSGKVAFGINHEMTDFAQNRKKDLDLVLCVPSSATSVTNLTLATLAQRYAIHLEAGEQAILDSLPQLRLAPVGAVLVAVESKACMTAHVKALPRLYDELNSSQQTIRGNTESAVAVGLALVNAATEFLSPTNGGKVAKHRQPHSAERTVAKISELRRRAKVADDGFDALGVVVLDCRNDGSPVSVVTSPPAPPVADAFHYDQMVNRIVAIMESRFAGI
jgi:hypothetical protein